MRVQRDSYEALLSHRFCNFLLSLSSSQFKYAYAWLGGAVVRALDWRLEVAGSIPAAALSSATLDNLFTHTLSSASGVTTLLRYINQFKLKKKQKPKLAREWQKFLSAGD